MDLTVFFCGYRSRFFLEEDTLDSTGKLTRPKERAVNKIGHGGLLSFFCVIVMLQNIMN